MSIKILDTLHDRIHFAITDRLDGTSQAPYDSLNLAYHVGDHDANVCENRKKVLQKLQLHDRPLVFMNQVHSKDVFVVSQRPNKPEFQVTADALVTQRVDVALMVMVADCNPILIYDSKNHILSLIHAGRKGVELGILMETLQIMKTYFDSDVKHLYGVIGPGIRSCCYEVKQDVAQLFTKSLFPSDVLLYQKNKIYLDLLLALQYQWEFVGANKHFLYADKTCTACSDRYYSFRREKQCGRFGIVAGLKA